jgi:pimeloyl-ACP methyl ester carboxylesterase
VVHELVASLRGPAPADALRAYFETFFSSHDDRRRKSWILDAAVKTPPHVTSSVWEESIRWDDSSALGSCTVPLLYIDAGTPNANLSRAVELQPKMMIGRTVGSGHFSQLEVPEQVNAMLARFLEVSGSMA